jgi:hypothetical protein
LFLNFQTNMKLIVNSWSRISPKLCRTYQRAKWRLLCRKSSTLILSIYRGYYRFKGFIYFHTQRKKLTVYYKNNVKCGDPCKRKTLWAKQSSCNIINVLLLLFLFLTLWLPGFHNNSSPGHRGHFGCTCIYMYTSAVA